MPRLMLTVVVTTVLCGASWLYAYWLRPLTQIRTAEPVRVELAGVTAPSGQSDATLTQLRDHDWLRDPAVTIQQGDEAFLAFDSFEAIPGHRNRVRLTPCAFIWHVPGEESSQPYTIVCDSARLEFENEFDVSKMDLESQTPGRIVAGGLEGNVEITGPDGLVIRGREFTFSEEAESLYSDHRVQFAYGPLPGEHDRIEGSANKIQISLKPALSPVLGKDMPRIEGVAWVQLRSDVRFHIDTLDEEHHPLRIDGSCDGSFIYYLDDQLAEMHDNVHIQRPTSIQHGMQQVDAIDCDQLGITFIDADSSGPRSPGGTVAADTASMMGTFDFLELRHLTAEGSPVRMSSDEAGLVAIAAAVEYEASSQLLELIGDERFPVQAQMDDHRLWGRAMRLWHDSLYQLTEADCQGAGGMQQIDLATEAPLFEATWNESAKLGPDAESDLMLLTLVGRGRFVQPARAELSAQDVGIWLRLDAFDRLTSRDGLASGISESRSLPVVRALAQNDVLMMTAQATIHSHLVEAYFSEASLAGVDNQDRGQAQVDSSGSQSRPGPVWDILAERIVAHIQHDPVLNETLVGSIEGTGGIRVDRAAVPGAARSSDDAIGDAAVHFTGRRFQLLDAGGVNQTLHLYGHPAHFACGDVAIEGDDVSLDRATNLATINGPGSLSFPVRQGLFGESLPGAERIDVQWRERLTFDGLTAEFHTGVKVSIADSMILCERIIATINERIDFIDPQSNSQELALSTIVCRDRMELEVVDWQIPPEGGNPVIQGIRQGNLAEFQVDLVSGDFSALGPGEIDDWSRGESRRVMIAPGSVEANQPAGQEGDLPWDYTHLEFTGTLTGNLHDQVGQLNDQVEVTYAPVEHALSTFVRHDLSGDSASARNAVWLKCDRMQLRLADGESGRPFVQVAATGHAELEGQLFSAIADEVTYDEQLGMFSMRGLGHKAAIYYRESLDARDSYFPAQTIEFIPRRNHLTLDGSPGIRGVQ